jgi:ABC-2 type transport system permease protein
MRAVLLVAERELRQVLATRGFWVTLLSFPILIAVSIFASARLAPHGGGAFTLVDASGHYRAPIERRLELDHQRDVLHDLETYVERWKLASVDPGAVWARRDAWPADAAVARFIAEGGASAVLRRLQPRLPEGAPAFKAPARSNIEIAPPPGAPIDQGAEAFGRAIATPMQDDVETPKGKRPFTAAIYIPKDFGAPGAVARIWTDGGSNDDLIETVRQQLTAALRHEALEANGLSSDDADRIESLSAPIQISEPPPSAARGVVVTRSIVPLVLVYLLLIASIVIGQMMLQGVIEERSNKLLESVLACIRPTDLMYGKLLGLGAVGLVIVAAWIGCAVAATFLSQGAVADLLRPSLEAIDKPWLIALMIFYFMSGYLIVSMLFLAVGSLSDSMQDAQQYLMPVIMAIMLPTIMVIQASLNSPDSPIVHVLSWIPLYTPFAMLARLGTGVPLLEVLGAGALLIGFVALELALLGRLFRARLLVAGQPANLAVFAKLMLQSSDR